MFAASTQFSSKSSVPHGSISQLVCYLQGLEVHCCANHIRLMFLVTCEWQYACVDPLHCSCLQVLVAAGDSVWVVDADAAVDQGLTAGPLTRLAASPDGRFVAGFSASGRVLGSRSSGTAHRY